MVNKSAPGPSEASVFSPAKLNLYLAVTGKRADGFHNLISVVSPLAFGDTLTLFSYGNSGTDSLEIIPSPENPTAVEIPCGPENLVLKAVQAYRVALAQAGLPSLPCKALGFRLHKSIPHGAGLGGGSSNAVAALKLLQKIAIQPLDNSKLMEVAASLGSDCPLFLSAQSQIMRGRGELLEPVSSLVSQNLSGARVLLFKPPFGVPTAWAYQQLATNPALYDAEHVAEARVSNWLKGELSLQELLYNRFEYPVLRKFVALRVLFNQIRSAVGRDCLLSGSGSCCFLLNFTDDERQSVESLLREAFGNDYFLQESEIGC